MKQKPLSLAVVDLRDGLCPELLALFHKLASKPPAQRCRDFVDPRDGWRLKKAFVAYDWRQVGRRYLRRFGRRINPNLWIYQGGHHLAVHVHRPKNPDGVVPASSFADPDPCLCRIVET